MMVLMVLMILVYMVTPKYFVVVTGFIVFMVMRLCMEDDVS